jgi:hypothetical protein
LWFCAKDGRLHATSIKRAANGARHKRTGTVFVIENTSMAGN